MKAACTFMERWRRRNAPNGSKRSIRVFSCSSSSASNCTGKHIKWMRRACSPSSAIKVSYRFSRKVLKCFTHRVLNMCCGKLTPTSEIRKTSDDSLSRFHICRPQPVCFARSCQYRLRAMVLHNDFAGAGPEVGTHQASRASDPAIRALVSCYEFDEKLLDAPAMQVMHIAGPTVNWLDFVVRNRRGAVLHNYDLVMRPVANDKLYATIQLYEQGILSASAAIDQLQGHVLFDQLSFPTKKACEHLVFSDAMEVTE